MRILPKRPLAAGVAVAVVVAGGGSAIAAAKNHRGPTQVRGAVGHAFRGPPGELHRHPGAGAGDFFASAASYLGLTPAQLATQLAAGKTLAQVADATNGKSAAGLIAALVAAEKTELAAEVTAKRLTQAQADAIGATLQARITDLVNHVGGPRGGFGHRDHGDFFASAASYLGLTPAQLATQLAAGKTLAQVADATNGKSAAGLIAALVAAEKTELAAEVTAKRLTQAQADAIGATLQARITDLVNRIPGPRGPRRGAPSGMDSSPGAGAPPAPAFA